MKTALLNSFALVFLLVVACQDRKDEATCYLELDRPAPGRLTPRKPVACSAPVSRYKLEGPGLIRHFDPDGNNRLTYRVSYDPQGRPTIEERAYQLKPATFKLYGKGGGLEFAGRAPGKWETTRIRIELDQRGREVKMEKFVGAGKVMRVEREYLNDQLHLVSTYDGAGQLKNRVSFQDLKGRRIERMLDAQGNVLMEREVAGGRAGR